MLLTNLKRGLVTATMAATISGAVLAWSGAAQAQDALTDLGKGAYHFFAMGYGSLVVVGDNSVLVTDPAFTPRAQAMKAAIAKVTDKPISHVVLSHEHFDHVGGTEVFDGAKVVCQQNCAQIFDLDPLGLGPKRLDVTFDKSHNIDLGNKMVELTHITRADGIAGAVAYVPDAEVVSTVDLYVPKGLTNGAWLDDKNFLGTRKVLNTISKWKLRHALSGHSPVTDPAALRENAAYYNDLYDATNKALQVAIKKGGNGAAIGALLGPLPKSVKLPAYQDWAGYNEHLPRHVWRMGMAIMHGG